MKFFTTAGPIELIHPKDVASLIKREKAYQLVQQYVQTNHTIANPFWGNSGHSAQMSVPYTRSVALVEQFNDVEEFILRSLVRSLHEQNDIYESNATSFDEAIEDAAVECSNNFGSPTHAIVFSDNVAIVGQFDKDVLQFKELSSDHGALCVYMPNRFTTVYTTSPCPYIKVDKYYKKYVSDILLLNTLKKLGLNE